MNNSAKFTFLADDPVIFRCFFVVVFLPSLLAHLLHCWTGQIYTNEKASFLSRRAKV